MPPKGPEKQPENSVLDYMKAVAKTVDPVMTGSVFDKMMEEGKQKQQYSENKNNLLKNINSLKQNDKLFMRDFMEKASADVKIAILGYNLFLAKQNAKNNTNIPFIDANTFIPRFEAEKQQFEFRDKEQNKPIQFPNSTDTQEVGNFIDISSSRQQEISRGITDIINKKLPGVLILVGKADATRVTELGAEKVQNMYNVLRGSLISKGFPETKLPAANFLDITNKTEEEKQNILNKGFSYCRAMMQIAFLPTEQIQYLAKMKINSIDISGTQAIGTEQKGDKYTGGGLIVESPAGSSSIIELNQRRESLLTVIKGIQITYVVTGTDNQYHSVGGIKMGIDTRKNNELQIVNIPFDNSFAVNARISGGVDINKKAFFSKYEDNNTLRIVVDKTDSRINKGVNGGMPVLGSDINTYVQAVQEFRDKSVGNPQQEKYAENLTALLNEYTQTELAVKAHQSQVLLNI